jgi:thioredoxin 1
MSGGALYLAEAQAPLRAELDKRPGLLLLEFGTGWCGHCRAAQPAITSWLTGQIGIDHLRIEDGPGRALGRSFRVRMWPTLILLRDGRELARVVRPLVPADLAGVLDPALAGAAGIAPAGSGEL